MDYIRFATKKILGLSIINKLGDIRIPDSTKYYLVVMDTSLKLMAVIASIFSEAKILYYAIIILILCDQITGVAKAVSKSEFNWKEFNKLYKKIIVYLVVISGTLIFEKILIGNTSIIFTKAISAIIGFQELASSYINASEAVGYDLFKKMIEKMKQ